MDSMGILIVFIIFIIYMWYRCPAARGKSVSRKMYSRPRLIAPVHSDGSECTNPHSHHRDHSDPHGYNAQYEIVGLNELEQDPQTRGFVPYANQPDHIGNMWKSDQSQSNGSGCGSNKYNSYEADIYTPIRDMAVNQDLFDVSNMHILSRFGSTSS